MCGILGWVGAAGAQPEEAVFGAALDLIRHRGPDGGNVWLDQGICLGHRRLAIIDLTRRADQPMRVDQLVLVFNGEIYNYRALRNELEMLGHVFTTSSDSEVLLRSWTQWGQCCLDYLEGMFAFAIWDRRERRLTLARDRYGEKPLFVHKWGGGLSFCSELPPLVRLASGHLQEDEQALGLYFLYSYIPAPRTIFRDVEQLEPGTWLEWSEDEGVRQGRYYDLRAALVAARAAQPAPDYPQAVAQLQERLMLAVNIRIESADVPVATLLSGGIDSSVITALAAGVSPGLLSAYSLGFPQDPEFDETDHAQAVVSGLSNVRHQVINATEDRVLDFAPQVLDWLGEPFADASILPTSLLCSQIEEKVALGGDAADELFGGYGVYPAIMRGVGLPAWFRTLLLKVPAHPNPTALSHPALRAAALFHRNLRSDALGSYLSWRTYASPAELEALGVDTSGALAVANGLAGDMSGRLSDIQATDMVFNLPNDMLKKVDYAAMAHGLEVRLPFLDSGLVHWALGLPDNYRLQGGQRKRILRDAFAHVLPEQVLERRKMGFLLPIRRWFRGGRLRDELHALLIDQTRFDYAQVRVLLQAHSDGKADHSVLLWSLYVYLRWQNRLGVWAGHSIDPDFGKSHHADESVVVSYR